MAFVKKLYITQKYFT